MLDSKLKGLNQYNRLGLSRLKICTSVAPKCYSMIASIKFLAFGRRAWVVVRSATSSKPCASTY